MKNVLDGGAPISAGAMHGESGDVVASGHCLKHEWEEPGKFRLWARKNSKIKKKCTLDEYYKTI